MIYITGEEPVCSVSSVEVCAQLFNGVKLFGKTTRS